MILILIAPVIIAFGIISSLCCLWDPALCSLRHPSSTNGTLLPNPHQ